MYGEALAQAERLRRQVPGWARGPVPSGRLFRLYEHLPPQPWEMEGFDHVRLRFTGGRFEDPRW